MARSHNVFPKQKGDSSCEGLRDGSTSILPFQFDAIKTGEEGDDVVGLEALPEELGEIRIEVWRAKSRTLNQPNGGPKAWSRPVERTYHEKVAARKRSHNVGFGAARTFSVSSKNHKGGRPMTVCDRVGSWPVMQYRFLYRSRAILEVAGITIEGDGDKGFELVEDGSEDDISSFSEDNSNDLFARASTASSEAKPRFRAPLRAKRESSNLPVVARSAKYAEGGKDVSEAIIISDDENDEGKAAAQLKSVRSELAFLRAQNERLRKRVKKEEVSDNLIELE